MAKFNLMHCIPRPRMHGLNGYKEVIESVEWGLLALGHEVKYSLNACDPSAKNIIFGAQVLPVEVLKQLPGDSIVYNFEQLRGLNREGIRPEMHYIANRFQIWEYSEANFDAWNLLGADNPKWVPVGYAPILSRITKPPVQDIDILIYGLSGKKRVQVFHRLSLAGFTVLFVSGLYGESRDMLIARSKLILNINLYDFAQIFEIVRVSYLFANKKAVIATRDGNTYIEMDIKKSVKFTSLETIVDDCACLINNESERSRLESVGYESFIKRDIKEILRSTLIS